MSLDLTLVKVYKDTKANIEFVHHYVLGDGELSPSSTINWKYVLEVELETISYDPQMPAHTFSRPLCFEKAIEWVENNIDGHNSKKAIETLLKMKDDSTLYLHHY